MALLVLVLLRVVDGSDVDQRTRPLGVDVRDLAEVLPALGVILCDEIRRRQAFVDGDRARIRLRALADRSQSPWRTPSADQPSGFLAEGVDGLAGHADLDSKSGFAGPS